MFFYLDKNDRMIGYDEALLEPERKHVECEHFADSELIQPKWDYTQDDWIESVTQEELNEMSNNQETGDSWETVHDKLDEILNLLKKEE